MIMKKIVAEGIPAVLWGGPSDKIYIYVHGKQGYKEYAEAFAKIAASMVPTPTSCSAPNAQMEIIELIITKVMSKMFFTVLNFTLTAKAMAITIPSPEATNILAFTHKKTPHARMMLPRMQ